MQSSIISAIQSAGSGFIDKALAGAETTPRVDAAAAALRAEVKTADAAAREYIDTLDDLLAELLAAYEELGYQNGFRIGVRLMAECMKQD